MTQMPRSTSDDGDGPDPSEPLGTEASPERTGTETVGPQPTGLTSPSAVPSATRQPRARDAAENDRATWPAILRGFRRRCPNCGSGALFRSYLKVTDTCPVCREDYTPQRADDGPAYLTILVVGHLLAPIIHVTFTQFRPSPAIMATIFIISAVGLSLYLLPRLKGVVVAIQWSRRMHGFGRDEA